MASNFLSPDSMVEIPVTHSDVKSIQVSQSPTVASQDDMNNLQEQTSTPHEQARTRKGAGDTYT